MQTIQTVVGFIKRYYTFSPLLLLIYAIAVLGLSTASHAPAAFADCATGVQGVQGNTKRPDATKCYDPTTNAVVGDATGTPAGTTTPTGQNNVNGAAKDTNVTTCAVEKIGWFICPVMEQAAKISDKAFQLLADNFLRTDPELVSNQSGTKTAWEIARNIANVMFIIAFLAVIVSQVTGMGINNYGLKKMIPRLLVGAIAVNVSYYICQLAVDLTNIFGYEIEEAMSQIANNLGPSVFGSASELGAANYGNTFGNLLTTIIVGLLAVAGVVWLIMGPAIAVVAMALITVLTIIIILLLRKALIVLLIVVSPIAFVLYLLPNTEGLFTKWRKAFTSLLFVFPVVGVLFGAGQLASTIIIVSGAESQAQADASKGCQPDNATDKANFNKGVDSTGKSVGKPGAYDSCGLGSVVITGTKDGTPGTTCSSGKGSACKLAVSWMLGLTAMLVAVAPLLAVWGVLKGALAAAGSIGGKVNATITKGGGNVVKRAQAADQARQNRMALNGVHGGGGVPGMLYRRRAIKNRDRKDVEALLNRASGEYVNSERLGKDGVGGNIGGGAGGTLFSRANAGDKQRLMDAARAMEEHEKQEQQKGTMAQLRKMTSAEQEAVMLGGTVNGIGGEAAQEAAILKAAIEGNIPALEKAMSQGITTGSKEMQHMIAEAIDKNYAGVKSKAAWMTDGGLLDNLREGKANSTSYTNALDNSMKSMSDELLSTQKESTLGLMEGRRGALAADAANPNSTSAAASADIIASLKRTSDSLSKNANNFGRMSDKGKSQINQWKL